MFEFERIVTRIFTHLPALYLPLLLLVTLCADTGEGEPGFRVAYSLPAFGSGLHLLSSAGLRAGECTVLYNIHWFVITTGNLPLVGQVMDLHPGC